MATASAASGYSLGFDRALMVAGLVHAEQKRKGTEVPYLVHPVHVAMILARHGCQEPLLTAAVLHDVLEDIEPGDLRLQHALRETFPAALRDAPEDADGFLGGVIGLLADEFGEEVLAIVQGLTDPRHREDGTRMGWAESKRLSHARLADERTPLGAVLLKCADSLHNARQVVNDLRSQGLPMMRRFKATPEATLEHYATVWRLASRRLGGQHPLVCELGEAVADLGHVLAHHFDAAHARVREILQDLTSEGRP